MSFVGKVLSVVQLVFSICLMMFAGAVASVQTNWKKQAETYKASLDKKNGEYSTLEQNFKKYQDDMQVALNKETANAQTLQANNANLTAQVDSLTQQLDSFKATATQKGEIASISAEDDLERRREALALRELYKVAIEKKDELMREKSKLEDEKFEQNVQIERQQAEYIAQLKENKRLTDLLIAKGVNPNERIYDAVATPPAETVTGKVLAVTKSKEGTEYIEISVGSDDGLVKGHQLYVYHTGDKPKYLGKIQLVFTQPDKAVGIVLDKTKNGIIEKGDRVSTKL
ncbi:MAG TPA: hypothetical protein VHB77_15730 [Planctomycetaceae bacterium]|nr:hypothetical protein [Planctomycetaceae bacterium]